MTKKSRHEDEKKSSNGSGSSSGGYSCRPNAGETYLTIGQDFFSIQNYILEQYNASLHRGSTLPLSNFRPAAAMVYTDIQTLRGLDQPVDYGSGIEYATGLVEALGGSGGGEDLDNKKMKQFGLQIGLWLNGTQGCQDIVSGALQDNVDSFLQYLVQDVPDTIQIFLRVGYEFDNPNFGYSQDPNLYRLAYRALVDRCEELYGTFSCRNKIAFCWHSWAAPRSIDNLMDFYPGDSYVDWVGISIFQQVYPWAAVAAGTASGGDGGGGGDEFAGGSMAHVREVLDLAHSLQKPIMIAESTPFGGINNGHDPPQDPALLTTTTPRRMLKTKRNSTNITTPTVVENRNSTTPAVAVAVDADIWNLWFQPTLDLIDEYDIGMWSYIDCDWNAQPMWKGVGFGDTRLVVSGQVMDQWWEHVLSNPRFTNVLECSSSNNEEADDDDDQPPTTRKTHKKKTHKKHHDSYHEYNYNYDSKNHGRPIEKVDEYHYDSNKNGGKPVHYHYDSRYGDTASQKDSKNNDPLSHQVGMPHDDSKENHQNDKPSHDSRHDEASHKDSKHHHDDRTIEKVDEYYYDSKKNHGKPVHYHYDSRFNVLLNSAVPSWLLSSSMTPPVAKDSADEAADATAPDHDGYEYDYQYEHHGPPIPNQTTEYEYSYDSKKHHGKPVHYHYHHHYGSTLDQQQESLYSPGDDDFTRDPPMMISAMVLLVVVVGAALVATLLVVRRSSFHRRVEQQRSTLLDESSPMLTIKERDASSTMQVGEEDPDAAGENPMGSAVSKYGAL